MTNDTTSRALDTSIHYTKLRKAEKAERDAYLAQHPDEKANFKGGPKAKTAKASEPDTADPVTSTLEVVRAAASQPAKKGKPNAEASAKEKAEGLLSQIQSGERQFVFRDEAHREAIVAKLSSDDEGEQIEGLKMFGPVRARTLKAELDASDMPDDVKYAVGRALTSNNVGQIKWGMYAATELLAGRPFEIRGLTKPAGSKTTSATSTTPTPKPRKEQKVKVTGVVLPTSDDDVNLAEKREADMAAAEELAADMADDEYYDAFAEYVRANDATPEGERPEKWYKMGWMLDAIVKPTPYNLNALKGARKVFTAVTARFRDEQLSIDLLAEAEVAMALYFNQGFDREVRPDWVRELFEKLYDMKGNTTKVEFLIANPGARHSLRVATDYVFVAFHRAMKQNPYARWFEYDVDGDGCAERLWSELQEREAKRREKRDAKAGQHGHGHSGDVPGLNGSKPTQRVSKGSRSKASAKKSRAKTPAEKAATVARAAEKDFVQTGNPNPQGPDAASSQASRGKVVAGAGMTRAQKTARGKKG